MCMWKQSLQVFMIVSQSLLPFSSSSTLERRRPVSNPPGAWSNPPSGVYQPPPPQSNYQVCCYPSCMQGRVIVVSLSVSLCMCMYVCLCVSLHVCKIIRSLLLLWRLNMQRNTSTMGARHQLILELFYKQ